MERSAFAGSRIRERRVALGLRQAEVALRAGISGSYLNLIEHNRRRIGGKVLLNIAAALEIRARRAGTGGRKTPPHQPARRGHCAARCGG